MHADVKHPLEAPPGAGRRRLLLHADKLVDEHVEVLLVPENQVHFQEVLVVRVDSGSDAGIGAVPSAGVRADRVADKPCPRVPTGEDLPDRGVHLVAVRRVAGEDREHAELDRERGRARDARVLLVAVHLPAPQVDPRDRDAGGGIERRHQPPREVLGLVKERSGILGDERRVVQGRDVRAEQAAKSPARRRCSLTRAPPRHPWHSVSAICMHLHAQVQGLAATRCGLRFRWGQVGWGGGLRMLSGNDGRLEGPHRRWEKKGSA